MSFELISGIDAVQVLEDNQGDVLAWAARCEVTVGFVYPFGEEVRVMYLDVGEDEGEEKIAHVGRWLVYKVDGWCRADNEPEGNLECLSSEVFDGLYREV